MQVESYRKLYKRELEKLQSEIELYKDENTLWIVDKEIANSAGHLCLHLIGNLNHFIGAGLGKIDYVRNRDLEFISDDVPREKLIEGINATTAIVDSTLRRLPVNKYKMSIPFQNLKNQHQ